MLKQNSSAEWYRTLLVYLPTVWKHLFHHVHSVSDCCVPEAVLILVGEVGEEDSCFECTATLLCRWYKTVPRLLSLETQTHSKNCARQITLGSKRQFQLLQNYSLIDFPVFSPKVAQVGGPAFPASLTCLRVCSWVSEGWLANQVPGVDCVLSLLTITQCSCCRSPQVPTGCSQGKWSCSLLLGQAGQILQGAGSEMPVTPFRTPTSVRFHLLMI